MSPVDVSMISTSLTVYTLLYVCICFCFIVRTQEFESSGISIENIFEKLLPYEHANFVMYHMQRSALTLFVHSALPSVYFIGILLFSDDNSLFENQALWWNCILYASFIFPLLISFVLLYWAVSGWKNHYIVRKLEKLCVSGKSWRDLAFDINNEYRRVDKFCIQTCATVRVIITENWIIKVTPYTLDLAPQNDCALIARNADIHSVSADGEGTVQYINLEVKSISGKVKPFCLRFNALDFNYLQSHVRQPVDMRNITFYRTRIDRFVDVFSTTVQDNPVYAISSDKEIDVCIGCMQHKAEVKLSKCCGSEECMDCHCIPLWCLSCMGKWFASRQNQDSPETWLQSTCTCPVCRAVFCVLDVCLISSSKSEETEDMISNSEQTEQSQVPDNSSRDKED